MSVKMLSILVADDDHEDRQLIQDALKESRLLNPLHFVGDGEALLKTLHDAKELPGLILLDLNMPKMDGREALKEIKSNPRLKRIPVVILTTSGAEEDVYRTYNLGVNSFITKPVKFSSLVEVLTEVAHYWFEIVKLPASGGDEA
jgi:CheY-like chemotaxis protein